MTTEIRYVKHSSECSRINETSDDCWCCRCQLQRTEARLKRFAELLRDPDLMIEDCREGWSEEVDELLRDAGFKGRMEK